MGYKQPSDEQIAYNIARWLQTKGCTACVYHRSEGDFQVHYTLSLDTKPHPAVTIKNGSVVFPVGSDEDIVLSFLLGQ